MELLKKYYYIKQAKLVNGKLYEKWFGLYYFVDTENKLQKDKRINIK